MSSLRWRGWVDAAAVVGVVMSVLMLARGARPFVDEIALEVYGVDLPPQHHALLWSRLTIPAAIVVSGLLGQWIIAAVLSWAAVVVEAASVNPSVPGPVAATVLIITVASATLLSVRGGFHRGQTLLGTRRLLALAGAGLLIALAPVARILLSDLPFRGTGGDGSVIYAIDSRLDSAITMGQYLVVAAVVTGLLMRLDRPLRLRALGVLGFIVALVGPLLLAGDRPYGLNAVPPLTPAAALSMGLFGAGAVAVVLFLLVERLLDRAKRHSGPSQS